MPIPAIYSMLKSLHPIDNSMGASSGRTLPGAGFPFVSYCPVGWGQVEVVNLFNPQRLWGQ